MTAAGGDLNSRIDAIDPRRPYVWALRITAAEFAALEAAVAAKRATARQTLVYLAEWYRRRYDGSAAQTKAVALSAAEIGELWTEAGFDAEAFAYRYERKDGIAWEYSTYVLGGLAVRFETGRKDRTFLRQLCRLYYGEDVALDDGTGQEGRSVAFRQSVARHQSLYHFIRAILDGSLAGDDDLANELVQRVKTANDEVLREKFALEWLVRHQPGDAYMRRSLRLRLKPEEAGGTRHGYVRYERARSWGIADPASVRALSFAVSFEDAHGRVLVPADFDRPVLSCVNAGADERGRGAFVVADPSVKIEFRRVPAIPFARTRLWVRADAGEMREVYAEKAGAWRQYWREDPGGGLWSTRKDDRKATAILADGTCAVTAAAEEVQRLPFKDGLGAFSPAFVWCVVRDVAVVRDAAGKEATVYSHAGTDTVYVRPYPRTICAEAGGLVRHGVLDEDGDEEEADALPILFRRDDVLVCHRDGGAADGGRLTDELKPDRVEFKDGGGYRDWTESQDPAAGVVTLRVTFRGREFPGKRMFYWPGLFEGADAPQPVVRDFAKHAIRYCGADGAVRERVCEASDGDAPIPRSLELTLDGGDDRVRLEVYAPFDVKEVYIDGRLATRVPAGETFALPCLLKSRVRIRDFGAHGYRSYDCGRLGSLYRAPFLGNENDAALNFWREGKKVKATELDGQAPDGLEVGFGLSAAESENASVVHDWLWVYSGAGKPAPWEGRSPLPAFSVAFQDLAAADGADALRIAFPKMSSATVDRLALFRQRPALATPYRCYEVATRFRQYFFIFNPLRKLLQDRRDEIRQEILEPLLAARGGRLTREDCGDLMRLSEEGRFDWMDVGVNLGECVRDDGEAI